MKIKLGSITYAMKAKELLSSHGIDVTVSKDLRSRGGGCVYAISFSERYRDAVYGILLDAGFELPPEAERRQET